MKTISITRRMHSSRMHTAHAWTIGWGVYLPGGVPARECTCLGVYLPGGYLPRGCTCPGGVPASGVYLPRYSPPEDRMTDRCKNITLPQTSFSGGKNGWSFLKNTKQHELKCAIVDNSVFWDQFAHAEKLHGLTIYALILVHWYSAENLFYQILI